ncbi:MAG TPA: asparagine synthase-related protein [Saprospiraceae bacterium]|nr:asparagine synthase-related protein [Saprospiraceae bacterium]
MGNLLLQVSRSIRSEKIAETQPVLDQHNLLFKSDLVSLYFDLENPVLPVKILTPEYTCFLLGNFTFYNSYIKKVEVKPQIRTMEVSGSLDIQELFQNINGVYCCIQIHKFKNIVNVITDCLGFYPLYIFKDEHQLLISNEIKQIKILSAKPFKWNEEAIHSYLYNGHLISNQTWFHEVTRLRPASEYVINCNTFIVNSTYYWTWSQLRHLSITKSELIELYAEKFKQGIDSLEIDETLELGLSLSGGLDSRWIAYEAAKKYKLRAFSFGHCLNRETQLAQQVAKSLKIEHEALILSTSDWLQQRLQAFWKVDGLLHLEHLHEVPVHTHLAKNYPVYFHGFFGGGIYGNMFECNQRINPSIANRHFHFGISDNQVSDPFYSVHSIDPYIIDQKIRNQSAYSIYLLSSYCQLLLPFYNMDWMELNYGVDEKLQINGKFYLEVLNEQLSAELLQIPWQRTGITPRCIGLNTFAQSIHLPAIKEKCFQSIGKSRHFVNYNLVDPELNSWLTHFDGDFRELGLNYKPTTREQKFRVLSLVLIMKMMERNTWDVI